MSRDGTPAFTLCVSRCRSSDAGHRLGLKKGDVLIGVNARRWNGSEDNLRGHFANGSVPVALTFQRGQAVWSVLADRFPLAQWEQVPAPMGDADIPQSTEFLCNWEIVANADWTHDLFPLRPSFAALVVPALWLAQQRLWTMLATMAAVLAVALPAGAPVLIALWLAAGLLLWRSGTDHIRADRAAAGFHRVGVVAARTEMEAIAVWENLSPKARFRYERAQSRMQVPSTT